ncbi:outer membrane protein transport protein [Psychromonas sp. Urea-02u-13]|uniref:outer membrane protein transport protein n=1 Tax=Psychromonas sp. Urea-02u-13 TaxID=2058326 RepID=UPI000C33BD80|nr:outer membrane protein transport protein [Psychromonas sp. Urea-02u-13]PKG38531.1 aromatic hydrocarbon degradation protein [Psychromonas sp. Urea-02u-13]
MKKTALFTKTAIVAALALSTTQVIAAGFQLNAQSATGLGRAFAGDAVIADNASVMARNAAAMALFDKTELSLGLNVLKTEIEVNDATYVGPTAPSGTSSNYDDAGDTSLVPNIHLIVPINEQFAVGINLYSNFGTKTEFDDSFSGSEYGGLTDVKSVNLGLAASYRINQQWSVGGGLDIIYGTGKLERSLDVGAPEKMEVLNADASGVGLGFNLGTVFELNENNRFGLSYHYSPELEAEGDIYYNGTTAKDDTLYMPLPDMAEFSGYHRLTDSKFAVHYSVQWIGWGAFDTLDSKAHGTLNEYQWKDAMHFSLGGTYYLNNSWTLRSGYMYDQSAQDEVTSTSVPDSDRQWFSAGFTYHFSDDSNLDLGATYLVGQDVFVTESTEGVSQITGTTRANAILVAVQYSHSF